MSGIFDALRTALKRPEGDRVDQEERDIHSDGDINQANIGDVSHHRQASTAPSTPAKVGAFIDDHVGPSSPSALSTAPEPGSPAEDADTSYSSAADISGTTMSTQAEIQMCPQPMPFVYRRRAMTDGQDETLSKAVHFNPHLRQRSSPANVHIRPDTLELVQPPYEPSAEVINKGPGLTQWRQEQLDNVKPGKLTGNGTVKVLSSLHGPLSLPYARNPSGVDATVPDTSSHYANTFGSRAVPRHGDARVVSGSTDSTQVSTQSSSNSSLYLGHGQKHFSDSERGHLSNMVIRDPIQGNASAKGFDGKTGRSTGQFHYNTIKEEFKSSLNPSSVPFDSRAMAHRALGVQHPSAMADPFKPLVEAALARAIGDDAQNMTKYDDATIARLMSTARYYGLQLRKASDSSSTGSRIPSNDSSLSSIISKMPLTPGQIAANHASKADVSANWRVKGKYHDPSGHIEVHSPSKQFALPAECPPGPIMTIDELMEKFSSPPGKDSAKPITVKAPESDLTVEAPTKPVSKHKGRLAAATPSKPKSPLGERSTNMSPPPVPAAKAVDAKKATPKGTPGAGRLLKKSHGSSNTQTKSTVPSKSAPKLVPITEHVASAE